MRRQREAAKKAMEGIKKGGDVELRDKIKNGVWFLEDYKTNDSDIVCISCEIKKMEPTTRALLLRVSNHRTAFKVNGDTLFYIAQSTLHEGGLGLFAGRNYSDGDEVTVFKNGHHAEGYTLGSVGSAGPTELLFGAHFINGVDKPTPHPTDREKRANVGLNNIVFALRDILNGEEMLADYGKGYWENCKA